MFRLINNRIEFFRFHVIIFIDIDDHWKKEFLGDNTAMLLTDVSRDVKNIQKLLSDNFQDEEHSRTTLNKTAEYQLEKLQQDRSWEEKRLTDTGVEVTENQLVFL